MTESGIELLRIYCICGQKMKIAANMYGRPGKCVSCRQKIRLPRPDEVPEGATEIRIEDHPEFLRKSRRSPDPLAEEREARQALAQAAPVVDESGDSPTPITELDIADEEPPEREERPKRKSRAPKSSKKKRKPIRGSLPLDVLPSLRTLCSLQFKLEHTLEASVRALDKDNFAIAEIEGNLARLYRVRGDLDEQLRQTLMEVAIELSSTQEKISEACLSARVGEIPYEVYHEKIYRLRGRRDRLERRQHNLRGWLSAKDPHVAGGYVDLDLDTLPEENVTLTIPSEPEEADPLLNVHVSALRSALNRQDLATRKLTEMRALNQSKQAASRHVKIDRANCKADLRIAQATVAFSRGRLRELKSDFESDIETIGAQLDLERAKLKTGSIERTEFDTTEKQLFRAKADALKALSISDRALIASEVNEVPHLRGTFLERLTARHPEEGVGVDSILAWVAAALMALAVLMPAFGDLSMAGAFRQSSEGAGLARWVVLAPVAVAVIVALIGWVGDRPLRGRLLCVAWLAVTVAGAWIIHQAQFGLDPISVRFRVGSAWIGRPGMFTLVGASFVVLAAAAMALRREKTNRAWVPVAAALGVASALVIFTDMGGVYTADPSITVTHGAAAGERDGVPFKYNTVKVRNNGRRTLYLLSRASEARGAFLFSVDRQIGQTSWNEVDLSESLGERSSNARDILYEIGPGDFKDIKIPLPPGNYRVYLQSNTTDDMHEPFSIEAPPAPPKPVTTARAPVPVILEPPRSTPIDEGPVPEVELKGVGGAPGAMTRFQFVLYLPDGRQEQETLSVEDTLYGSWTVDEYNRNLGSVTLRSGTKLLVLRTGERRKLQLSQGGRQ